MTKVTIIYPAKCKDCLYCKAFYISDNRVKRHICTNPVSPRYWSEDFRKTIRKRDNVCVKWELN